MRVLFALGLPVSLLLHVSTCLLLGAFNIRSFGDKKSSNTTLMDIISTIVHRYDVILIQEVRDNDLSATKKLMARVNKEERVAAVKHYTYDDGCEACGTDTFSREPFIVMFSSKYTTVETFVLIPQHTSPDYAVVEVDALYDVVADARHRWNTNDVVLLGDFNAGCSFVTSSEWQQIRLFTDQSFLWLIPDQADTTVTHTNCPYDRIVVSSDMMKGVVEGSAGVYDYMLDLDLSLSLALAVSDHFPVEVTLVGSDGAD
nr:deoxyribonuclease-1 isoform X2 [Nothobranchius furzeri]